MYLSVASQSKRQKNIPKKQTNKKNAQESIRED